MNQKYGQLIKEHERCEQINTELKSNLRHTTQQWINEKRKRQNAELERDFYVSANESNDKSLENSFYL